MKKSPLAALTLGALLATAAAAGAADSMMSGHDAMAQPANPNTATMICRPAATGEKANAMTTDEASLVCKNIDMAKVEHGPAMPAGASASDVNKAWVKMLVDYSFINSYGS